jgi:hypothetical protein
MIYQTISESQFVDAFNAVRPDNFSYNGLCALYEYLGGYYDGDNYELDVIGICCDFSEYKDIDELREDYAEYELLSDFEDRTTVIKLDNGGLIIQQF